MGIDAEKLLQRSRRNKILHPDDIPELDLYIDQIISLMCAHLGSEGEREPLTRTMIHNYSKAGLISPVRGKKYSKEHILQMLAIYSLKNTLSIAQIKRVLAGAAASGMGEAELARCFETQIARRDAIDAKLRETAHRIVEENQIKLDTPEEVLSFLLTLTDITDTLSRFAAAISEEYFPDPEPPKKKDKKEKKPKKMP